MPLVLPPLPDASFAAIAVELRLFAETAARAAAAGEIFVVRGGWSENFAATVAEQRAAAVLAGQLHGFFLARSEPEEERRLRRVIAAHDGYAGSRRRWRLQDTGT